MTKPGQPLISIISINFNQPELTYLFLDSVNQLTYKNIEVLIIDNASTRAVTQFEASTHFKEVKVLFAPENGGFGYGNNLGLQRATGEFMLLVNNDTELKADLLENLLLPFTESKVGVVCPKIVYFDAPEIIQYAGFTKINPITGRNRAIGFGQKDSKQFNIGGETFGAHGAAMLVKKEIIDKTNGFYEPFFLYYEEIDWSYRIMAAGFSIYYQPSALVFHKESMSVGKNSMVKIFFLARNRLLFMKRNSSKFNYMAFVAYNFLCAMPVHAVKFLCKLQFRLLFAFINGNIKGLSIPSHL